MILSFAPEADLARPHLSSRGVAFNFGRDKVRGLNIGGFLLLEPWITPSIFDKLDPSLGIVDEFTLTQKLGAKKALEILKPHVSLRNRMTKHR